MMPSTSIVKKQKRNWLDIPSDVMENILYRIGMVDILESVQFVCTAWYKICKDPAMWRVINMDDFNATANEAADLCKHVVDRSKGQLVDITLTQRSDDLLSYVADRSSGIRRLKVVGGCLPKSLTAALMNFPLLEELDLYSVEISKEVIETIGSYCSMLRTLKANKRATRRRMRSTTDEEIAIAIGQNLPELRHLELVGSTMTDNGLQMILDKCHQLETLVLDQCFNIDLTGDVVKKCSEQIKCLSLPLDGAYTSNEDDYYYYDYGFDGDGYESS